MRESAKFEAIISEAAEKCGDDDDEARRLAAGLATTMELGDHRETLAALAAAAAAAAALSGRMAVAAEPDHYEAL